ncbi:MAG TPA: ABC transporter permease, partial [Piscirickettsiaceae bacterium]|nr:ABC transporter permease [Piscirickettsiaceae bacterium]
MRLWLGILLLWGLMAVAGWGVGNGAMAVQLDKLLALPDWQSWLGYDQLGRPVGARLLLGAQTSLVVALSVVSLSALIGTAIGLVSG